MLWGKGSGEQWSDEVTDTQILLAFIERAFPESTLLAAGCQLFWCPLFLAVEFRAGSILSGQYSS